MGCFDNHSDCERSPELAQACNESLFEAALRRAFVDRRADFIVLYDRRQRFLIESVNHGVVQGWLVGEVIEYEQSTEERYRLTDAGRRHFGLPTPPSSKEPKR